MSSASAQPRLSVGSSTSWAARLRAPREPWGEPAPALWTWPVWVVVVAATIGAAIAIVWGTAMHPSYDAYGWLVWGHQLLYGRLNLNAAPSWKPLTFIFTLPYALFSKGFAVKLWSVTANVGTLAMAVFAYRIVYRVSDDLRGLGRWGMFAAFVGALFAGGGELGLQGLAHLDFIANSDPLNAAIVLAAFDAHFSRRPRLAFAVLFVAALGRPELWVFLALYGLWLAWRIPTPQTFALVIGLGALTLAAWLIPDAIWSTSVVRAGQLNLHYKTAVKGDKFIGVLRRWASLYEWPMQAAALIAMAIIVVRRDRRGLLLIAAALLFLAIEIGFAYHGFTAVPRYLLISAAIMVVIAGVGIARLVAGLPDLIAGARASRLAAVAGPLVVIGLLVAIAPFAHKRVSRVHTQLPGVRNYGVQYDHLARVVGEAGGAKAILACGPVAAYNQYQSQLAYVMGLNVAPVLYNPGLLLSTHRRIMLFDPVGLNGWQVRGYNVPGPLHARCSQTFTVASS